METNAPKYCRNCQYPLEESAKYCPQCSQKNTDGKVPVLDFIQEFFTNLFNIDSKLFLTFFALFIPGKLTIEYFKGKHRSYASPVRLFLYAGITLFAIVIAKTQDVDMGRNNLDYAQKVERTRIKNLITSKIAQFNETYLDSVKHYQSDSLRRWIMRDIGTSTSDSMSVSNNFGFKKNVLMSTHDLANLSIDSLVTKYEIKDGFDRILFSQQVKTMRDEKGLFHFFIGKLPILIFFMMPFLALIAKVLYARHNYYFVEHLVFSFHYHTFTFLVILFLVLFGSYLHGTLIALSICSIYIYQFIAIKRFYKQGYFKTFAKFSLLNFLYLFLVFFFFIIGVMLSFFLF